MLLTVFEKSDSVLVVVCTADEAELTADEVVPETVLMAELAALEMAPVISPKPKEIALKVMMRNKISLSIAMLMIISILLNRYNINTKHINYLLVKIDDICLVAR